MSVNYIDDGNDDGSCYGRSDGKIGFFGLTTPVVKSTVTLTTTAGTTVATTIATDLVALKSALAAYGIV